MDHCIFLARQRLANLIRKAMLTPKVRRATRAPARVRQQRLDQKRRQGELKRLRGKPAGDD